MMLGGFERPFLGQGWSFPLEVNNRGGISMSRLEQDIEESIRIILGTAKGERVMRPDFGSSIHEFIFAPNNPTTCGLISYHVQEALSRWEARIDLTSVDVNPDPLDHGRVLIDISYQVKATNDVVNMVYPFYLIPTEES